ncbi:unnamed protein product [Cylindrotheca closterium]|uniref:Alpha-L-fucosidase n=1 Tax=Cylindrotheca closterium TaxID=2856 RepID=A0AAD2CK83_9STRA|nr:unnamed protein product [Cylindrotheca closterium]
MFPSMSSIPLSRRLIVSLSCILGLLFECYNDGFWGGNSRIRHPLTTSLRRRLSDRNVRFLAFGGPSTWGFGLEDPNDSTFSTILSDGHVHNAGQLVSSTAATTTSVPSKLTGNLGGRGWPTLASLCTQSIVGDDNVYDVILIETSFYHFHAPSATFDEDDDSLEEDIQRNYDALGLLASRIRQRFPLAKIIFVQLWDPSEMNYLEENHDDDGYDYDDQYRFKNTIGKGAEKKVVTFDQWRNNQTEVPWRSFWESKEYHQAVKRHDWMLSSRKEDTFDLYLNNLANKIQAFMYKLPRPSDPTEALAKAQKLFVEVEMMDYDRDDGIKYQYALSSQGHRLVATSIRSQYLRNIQSTILQSSDEWRNRVGDWGSGDSCQLWYETNQIDNKKLTYQGLSLRSFSKPMTEPKYALELSSSEEDGGTITVTNPFPESRMVYLTYMTTSDFAFSNKVYPSTKVQVSDKSSVVLDPRHEGKSIQHQIPRTTAIGMIPGNHAQTTIRLETVEGTVSPFRIVGVSLLYESGKAIGSHKIPSEFSLIIEPTHVSELHKYADFF